MSQLRQPRQDHSPRPAIANVTKTSKTLLIGFESFKKTQAPNHTDFRLDNASVRTCTTIKKKKSNGRIFMISRQNKPEDKRLLFSE